MVGLADGGNTASSQWTVAFPPRPERSTHHDTQIQLLSPYDRLAVRERVNTFKTLESELFTENAKMADSHFALAA